MNIPVRRAFPQISREPGRDKPERRLSVSDQDNLDHLAQDARQHFLQRHTLQGLLHARRKRRNSESQASPKEAKKARIQVDEPVPIAETLVQTGLGVLKEITLHPTRRCVSLTKYLNTLNIKLERRLRASIKTYGGLKTYYAIRVWYAKVKGGSHRFSAFLHTELHRVTSASGIPRILQRFEDEILERNANFIRHESGLIVDEVAECRLNVAKYSPLWSGSTYAALPKFLADKKAIVNVRNTDNRCFGYSILAYLHYDKAYANDRGAPKQYDKYFATSKLVDLEYPVEIASIPEIEERLKISINVFSFYDDQGRARYPVHISDNNFEKVLDLLFWNDHYAYIVSFQRFMSDITKSHKIKHFCRRCLCHFSREALLTTHAAMCSGITCQPVVTMPPAGSHLSFQNDRYMQRIPFVVFADFECLTTRIGDPDGESRKTKPYQSHVPCSVGLFVSSTMQGGDAFEYEWYTGKDVCEKFLQRLCDIEEICVDFIFKNARMVMNHDDELDFDQAVTCYVCGKPFGDSAQRLGEGATGIIQGTFNPKKVRDHDHITGKYRGAAHQTCNLRLRKTYKIPVIFHNLRGYDSHLLVAAFGKHKDREITVIGQGIEKYLTIYWGDHIVFKDSLQFLGESLDNLTSCLLKSGRDKFTNMLSAFKDSPDDHTNLLLKKGVYPYDYMNAWEKLEETSLPPIEQFASKLRGTDCSDEDYKRAQAVWVAFDCKTMKDYHELYLKTDVLQLADVFESFRSGSMDNYKLDPAHYVSAPHLSWDAMLKMTQCNLQLLDDPEMFRMIDNNLRGGICMITKRYARANNPRLRAFYDPSKPTSHIMYWDANNLYGWAMSQDLPYDGFRWLKETEYADIEWTTVQEDGQYGYIVECDLDYPTELHKVHSDYPLAPEKVAITVEMLSDKQKDLHTHYKFNRSSVQTKLIPNLLPKDKYACHYRNLQFYLSHGMKLLKVHRVLAFQQSRWLGKYIETNQNLRAAANDEHLKKLYKDMNNSCFGKTCENQRKRSDVRVVTDAQKCKKLIEKPHCKSFRIFTEDVAAVDLSKVTTLINRPFYVSFCVLELSKLHMYRFHYDVIKQLFPGEKSQLLFTDTDSLMYEIFAEDVYEKVWEHKDLFDLAGYPADFYHDASNNKVIGKFKDEANSEPILEFVGLRPKMYSFIISKDAEAEELKLSEKLRAKGIARASVAKLRHDDFLDQLRNPHENYLENRRIGSKLHKIYTYRAKKRGLCAFDDKRYILEDGIETLAYGHTDIPARYEKVVGNGERRVQSFRDAVRNKKCLQAMHEAFPPGLDPKKASFEARKQKLDAVEEPVTSMRELESFTGMFGH